MSFISTDRHFIFIHVQRTGGTSISRTLRPLCEETESNIPLHPPAFFVRKNWPKGWAESFKVGFVRNPWDLWVSWYCGLSRFSAEYPTFREYMLHHKEWHCPPGFHFTNQAHQLCDETGKEIIVDFVGRYENIDADFAHVCRQIGIDNPGLIHINNSRISHGDYHEWYDPDTMAIVKQISEPTIRMFGYEY